MKTTREQAIGKIVDSLFAKIRLWSLNHEGNVKRSTKIYNYGVEEIEHLLEKATEKAFIEGIVAEDEVRDKIRLEILIKHKPKENHEISSN